MEAKELLKNGTFIGKSILLPKKSIKIIIDNLSIDEKILKVTSCNSDSKAGALAVTNKRVIFASKVLFSSNVKEFDINKITSIKYECSLTNKLKIKGSSDEIEITAIEKIAGQEIVNTIKSMQSSNSKTTQNSNIELNNLEKLADLKEKGIITEQEFELKKKQILGL